MFRAHIKNILSISILHKEQPNISVAWVPFEQGSASRRLRCTETIKELNRQNIKSEIYTEEKKYDVVIFQKTYSNQHLELACQLKKKGVKIIFDICDNYFHLTCNTEILRSRKEAVHNMANIADLVTVSSSKLAEVYNQYQNVEIVPDMPERLPHWINILQFLKRIAHKKNKLKLVWFGVAGQKKESGMVFDLASIIEDLNKAAQFTPFSLTIISNNKNSYTDLAKHCNFETHYKEWNYPSSYSKIISNDIALIPFNITPYTSCKTSNRLQLSFRLGLAVIATPIRSYKEFDKFFLSENWSESIHLYWKEPKLMQKHKREAKKLVNSRYSTKKVGKIWVSIIKNCISNKNRKKIS